MLLVYCLLLLQLSVRGQRLFTDASWGISIDTPVHWQRLDTGVTVANFNNATFTDEQLYGLMELHKGSVPILVMAKRAINDGMGIIPTMRISARYTNTTSLSALAFNLQSSLPASMKGFADFKYELPFSTFTLNGTQGLRATITFSIPQGSAQLHARTRFYMFLRKGYYIGIALSDSDTEDESDLFNLIAESLRFN